jgi:WD40 repeat protein
MQHVMKPGMHTAADGRLSLHMMRLLWCVHLTEPCAGHVRMWDLLSKKPCGGLQAHKGVVTSLCAVPQSSQLLTAGADCEIKLWA